MCGRDLRSTRRGRSENGYRSAVDHEFGGHHKRSVAGHLHNGHFVAVDQWECRITAVKSNFLEFNLPLYSIQLFSERSAGWPCWRVRHVMGQFECSVGHRIWSTSIWTKIHIRRQLLVSIWLRCLNGQYHVGAGWRVSTRIPANQLFLNLPIDSIAGKYFHCIACRTCGTHATEPSPQWLSHFYQRLYSERIALMTSIQLWLRRASASTYIWMRESQKAHRSLDGPHGIFRMTLTNFAWIIICFTGNFNRRRE